MQNPIYLHRPGHLAALDLHLGSPETTIVLGEVPVGRDLSQRRGLRVPDLLIAFGVDPAGIISDRGYSIERWSKPPDFVLEIASETTAENDVTGKREDYAAFGIPEYWRFDPSGGEYYGTALAGDRLVEGIYQPIGMMNADESRQWGRSEVLSLDLCWEEGQLRWYDYRAGRYLRTHDEEAKERIAAESDRDTERLARLAAEEERDAERRARLARRGEAAGTGSQGRTFIRINTSRNVLYLDAPPGQKSVPLTLHSSCRRPLNRRPLNRQSPLHASPPPTAVRPHYRHSGPTSSFRP